jgi:hypothetical protein
MHRLLTIILLLLLYQVRSLKLLMLSFCTPCLPCMYLYISKHFPDSLIASYHSASSLAFYRNLRFIAAFSSPVLTLFCKVHFNIVFTLRQKLRRDFWPSSSVTKIMLQFLIIRLLSTCPAHSILLNLIIIIIIINWY